MTANIADLHQGARGSVEWYLEQWEDVVHEVRAGLASDARNTADILGSLPEARVASSVPGRVRLRVNKLKGQDRLAQQCVQALLATPGISRAEANPLTRSLLVYYDTAHYPSLEALIQAMAGA